MRVYTSVRPSVRVRACLHVRAFVCMHLRMRVRARVRMRMCLCVRERTRSCVGGCACVRALCMYDLTI